MKEGPADQIGRKLLAALSVAALVAASLWILQPFLPSIAWAAITVTATWPLLIRLQGVFRGRRWMAAGFMILALLTVILGPLMTAVFVVIQEADSISARVPSFAAIQLPAPPEWISSLPFFGAAINERWSEIRAMNSSELSALLSPYAQTVTKWFVSKAGGIASVLAQFLLTVLISAVLYIKGETAADALRKLARQLGGSRGEEIVQLAARACRALAFGIIATAALQAFIGGLGLAVTGVPGTPLLTAIILILCLAQFGPLPVLIPATIWFYFSGEPLKGTVLAVFSVIAGTADNLIRPYLLSRGADMPFLLILAGVIGGLIAFGIIGLFIGPVVLVVMHTLLKAWISEDASS